MKKLMTITLAACMAAGFVLAADVTSVNTVGYSSIDTSLGLANTGYNFLNMSTNDGSWKLDTTIFGKPLANGDAFYVFNPDTFDLDQYNYGGGSWTLNPSTGGAFPVAAPVLTVGQGFIFVPNAGSGYVQAGQVPTNGTYTTTFAAGALVPFASKLPVALKVSDILAFANNGDAIYLFNPSTFDLDQVNFAGGGAVLNPSTGGAFPLATTDVVVPVGGYGIYVNNGGTVVMSQSISL